MKRKMTLVALGANCGFFGANGDVSADGRATHSRSPAKIAASAAAPKPFAERTSISRRDSGWNMQRPPALWLLLGRRRRTLRPSALGGAFLRLRRFREPDRG